MRAKRTDTSHREVIDALRACGWRTLDTHAYPGFVDAVAYKPASGIRLVEIKSEKGKLRPSQERLIAKGWPVHILRTAADAARLM